MPIYEYATDDGTKVELIRAMSDADKPVEDPEGKGRVFKRVHSIFAAQGGVPGAGKSTGGAGHVHSGMCGCGKKPGSCGM